MGSDRKSRKARPPAGPIAGQELLASIEPGRTTAAQAALLEDDDMNPYTGKPFSAQYKAILAKRKQLPVHKQRQEFLDLVQKDDQFLVLVGETGSGKTTQIPQFLLFDEQPQRQGKMIACTQPRRVAAMSVAKRVAEELDVQLGEEVGYTIRFDDNTGPKTVLKYMTDGMLLREAMTDPQLSRYSTIILDEAHERTVATDILMGLIKQITKTRKDLRIVVMSATLDSARFQSYFGIETTTVDAATGREVTATRDAPLLTIPGRTYPVEILYTQEPQESYLSSAVNAVMQIHQHEGEGDILCFLTGEDEIEDACRQVRARVGELMAADRSLPDLRALPLYSSLPVPQQQKIFMPPPGPRTPGGPPGRKVIFSTNIAETSLTIDGVVYVIDPGFCKQKVYNPRSRVESLLVSPISQASCNQRAGRAGRTRPGKCFRLFPESAFKSLIPQTIPEMQRSNLAATILQMFKVGIKDFVHFDFLDAPAPETLMRAFEMLNYLGAISDEGELTKVGMAMSEFPLDPQLTKALLMGPEYGCSEEMLTIVAMLSSPMCFVRPPDQRMEADRAKAKFDHEDGDHLTLCVVYNEALKHMGRNAKSDRGDGGDQGKQWDKDFFWQNYLNERSLRNAMRVRSQLSSILERCGYELNSVGEDLQTVKASRAIRRAITAGFFMQVAHLQQPVRKGNYMTVKDEQVVRIHPSSCMKHHPEWIVYHEFVMTPDFYARTVSPIEGKWLLSTKTNDYFDLATFREGPMRRELTQLVHLAQAEKASKARMKESDRKSEKREGKSKKRSKRD